jgi:hypothetical protein
MHGGSQQQEAQPVCWRTLSAASWVVFEAFS